MVQWKQVPSFCQPVLTTYCLCSCSPVSHPPAAAFQSVLCPFLSTIMHLRILKGASSPIVPQVSELAHMAVPCAPCITISAASQDTQILSPLLVTHSDIQEQPLQLKKIKFPALWSPFHHILCCRLGLWPYSTFTLLCGYRTIAQAVKWHRTWQSALAAFLLLSQSVLHPWAKDTFYCCSTANTWGCLCWVGKKPFFCLQRKVSLESLNSIWTLVNQRCGELIKIVVFIRCLSLTFL